MLMGLNGCNVAPEPKKSTAEVSSKVSKKHSLTKIGGKSQPVNLRSRKAMLEAGLHKPRPEAAYQVPKITHHIWLTKADTPSEIGEHDIEAIRASLMLTPPEEGWQHFLWCNNPQLIPKSISRLQPYGVKVMALSAKNLPSWSGFWQQAISQTTEVSPKISANMLRYLVLDSYGGVYMDTSYALMTTIADLTESYSLFTQEGVDAHLLGIGMIASTPKHPVLQEAQAIVKHTILQPKNHLAKIKNEKALSEHIAGSWVLTQAFNHQANQHQSYRDTFFPDEASSIQELAFIPTIWSHDVGIDHATHKKKDEQTKVALLPQKVSEVAMAPAQKTLQALRQIWTKFR